MPLTYSNYLKLDELLALQQPRSADPETDGSEEHDEMLFIITHQVYELWFKQVIHEFDRLQPALAENELPVALRGLQRVLHILKVLVAQMDIIETLSPISFNAFRDRLESASGFQSVQFRVVEFMLGQRSRHVFKHYPEGASARSRLEALLEQPSLYDSFLRCLVANGYAIPAAVLERDLSQPMLPSPQVQKQLIEIYRNDAQLYPLCELLLDLDEGLQEWRYRHVKMVQRTIGTKRGTGGSDGVDYLQSTLLKPLFPDLWAIRVAL